MAMLTYNSSFPSMSTTNTTTVADKLQIDEAQGTAVAVVNVFLAIIGTSGNFLIIIAILKTPPLRQKPSNNLILSLAVADLIVSMLAQPLFSISMFIKTIQKRCIVLLDVVVVTAAAFSGCSSVFHLVAISIDRAISAVKPHKHRNIMRKWSKAIVYCCWGLAIAYGGVHVKYSVVAKMIFRVILISGFAMMTCSYATIVYRVRVSNSVATGTCNARERALERRISGTVAIVILLYAVCWFPLVVYSLYNPKYILICSFDSRLSWIRSLLLANSSMNFFVYSLRIRQFRVAFVRLINRSMAGARKIITVCSCFSNEPCSAAVTQVTSLSIRAANTNDTSN